MRRAVVLLAAASLVLVGLVVANSAPKAPGCTWVGTPERDVKTGTEGSNVLCSEAGNDFVHGRGGNERIRAGAGRDVAVGGGGRDILRGGRGRDRLFAVDDAGGERVIGGAGIDQCFIDPGDVTFGCEHTFRSNEATMATALAQSLGTVMEIVEAVPTPTPVPIPPPVTTIITIVPPPNCGGHPAPPPIC